MPKLTACAPMLLVRDVVASADYFRDVAGFQYDLYVDPPEFGFCCRDGRQNV